MHKIARITIGIALGMTSTLAGTIDFEVGAPCIFVSTIPLTNFYSSQGVTFSGPIPGSGGAILDQCGAFGVTAHSGLDFLAFNSIAAMSNGSAALGPETVHFASPVSNFSIFAGGGSTQPTYTLQAFDAGSILLATTSGTPIAGQWIQLSLNVSTISYAILSFDREVGEFDDLTWSGNAAVPEPPTWMVTCFGTLVLAILMVRRWRACQGF